MSINSNQISIIFINIHHKNINENLILFFDKINNYFNIPYSSLSD